MSNYQSSYGKNIDHTKATREDYDAHVRKEIETMFDRVENVLANDHVAPLKQAMAENQKAVDDLISEFKHNRTSSRGSGGTNFHDAFAKAVEANFDQISNVSKRSNHILTLKDVTDMNIKAEGQIRHKAVGTMTNSASLTGDSVLSYSNQQAILPAQKVNFRDLMRTVFSNTGTYGHYKESGGEGSIGNQTEGNAKSQIDFDLTEVKTVNKYVSGFTRISKQLLKSLPFLQGTLPNLLLREFFQQENSYFKGVVAAAATGTWNTTSETDKVKKIIDYISYQRDADFDVAYALVSHTERAALDKLTYTTGYYANSGGVVSNQNGTISISGVPIIPVSWMTQSKILLVDSTYLERIEAEGLKVEFFEQDSDNVQKNLITVRVECYEEVNPMLGAAFTFANL